jgi:hypothetical protein
VHEVNREDLIRRFKADRIAAHAVLFEHRHPQASPAFHDELITAWHSDHANVLDMVFRGGAKSTISEEAICIRAGFREFRNCVIIGASEDRAKERLKAIKYEFETNEMFTELFGDMVGSTWAETKIITSTGIMIQAYGRGQSMRGAKHLDQRPDLLLGDDIEDEESVATPEARKKWQRWWTSVVTPSLDPQHKIRITATPLDEEALAVTFSRSKFWVTKRFPILRKNPETGAEESTWPERFPLHTTGDVKGLVQLREEYFESGSATEWAREYMVEAAAEQDKQFLPTHIKIDAQVKRRPWGAVYAFYDPARTVNKNSSHTGMAVWSWVGRRLVVWRSGGHFWKPDQLIDDIFRTDTEFSPIRIGVERDGLEEFLLQPLRHEQVKRQQQVPLFADKAPKGKIDFIKGLQPFFKAGEVIFATNEGQEDHSELRQQLLSFPTGRLDVPNALAYALRMRPGAPMYDTFSDDHVREVVPVNREPCYLVVNSDGMCVAGMVVQYVNGRVNVLADWLREGDPGTVLGDIVAAAGIELGRTLKYVAPAQHFSDYDNIGMRAAARRVPIEFRKGGSTVGGREELRQLMKTMVGSGSAFAVDPLATWTLRALAGGYCRGIDRSGRLLETAEENSYRVLIEGLESFCGLMRVGRGMDGDDERRYAYTPDGRQYTSARR